MLRELRIRDVAILEDVSVEFGPGLNVLTGETGAGKSIVLGALGLVLGTRGGAELVRTGKDAAEVQARFDRTEAVDRALSGLDVRPGDEDDGLVLRRIVTAQGRSRAYAGDAPISVAALRELGAVLVDYASQHEHQVLLDEARHRTILDRFGQHDGLLSRARAAALALAEAVHERQRLGEQESQRAAREDFLAYQLGELDAASPEVGEEGRLSGERAVLRAAVRLGKRARDAEQALYGGDRSAVDRLSEAARALREVAQTDAGAAGLRDRVEDALAAMNDAGRELHAYAERLREDPERAEAIDDRLALLHALSRKHRIPADELKALHERLLRERDELAAIEARSHSLDGRIAALGAEAERAGSALTAARRRAASRLSAAVEAELRSLAMEAARFVPSVEPLPSGLRAGAGFVSEHGGDEVRFLLSANPGLDPRPLAQVASGGELSRILLALRRALLGTASVEVQVAVFDEIDTGMGGATAEVVATKLREIAGGGQVLAITHLAAIAAAADRHSRVEKRVDGGSTRTAVVALDDEGRIGELMRMVAGSGSSETAEAFARELLRRGSRGPA